MTAWQSLQLISPAQWAYALGLAALFWWRGPSLVAWVLLADFAALLAIAGAMDFGLMGKDAARWSMAVAWVASVSILATNPGMARAIAAIGAFSIAIFVICLQFGVQFATTSAIVNASAFLMLAVAGIGMGGDSGAGRGHSDRPVSVGLQAGNPVMASGGMAHGAVMLSQDRGGH